MNIYILTIIFLVIGADATVHKISQPDHLEPVPAYSEDDYGNVVFHTLIKQRLPKIWMIVRPSFDPEYAVIISKDMENPGSDHLDYAEAENQIWHWSEDCTPQKHPASSVFTVNLKITGRKKVCPEKLDLRKNVPVKRLSTEITPIAVKEIMKAWVSVLARTKYPKEPRKGLDGTRYEFYAHYNLFGTTWSPVGGVPSLMVELGEMLIQYVKADYVERVELLRACVLKAIEIQRHEYKEQVPANDEEDGSTCGKTSQ